MQDQQAQIEVTMEQAKQCIAMADSLERLHKNRDFKKIFTECYFKDEPARLVGLKADPNMLSDDNQKAILKDIDGIGCLQQFFRAIYQRGAWAERALQEGENELAELAEEAEVIH